MLCVDLATHQTPIAITWPVAAKQIYMGKCIVLLLQGCKEVGVGEGGDIRDKGYRV